MKKILFYCNVILLTGILFVPLGGTSPNSTVDFSFDKSVVFVKKVSQVFAHLGISISTLDQANEFAQKKLLRKGERWDPQEKNEWHTIIREKKDLLLNDLKLLGMIDSVEPKQKFYRYILLMGGLRERLIARLDYLAELKQRGLTFKEIVLLGGERPLRDNEKNGFPADVTTEAHMMQYLCEHHPILKNDKILLVNAPMIKNYDGTFVRPTTDSTVVYFAQIAPVDGSCLVISNNPYILRQTKVTQRILDQVRFPTDGAGKKANQETIDIVMLMDEFARTIYEEFKQQQNASGHN